MIAFVYKCNTKQHNTSPNLCTADSRGLTAGISIANFIRKIFTTQACVSNFTRTTEQRNNCKLLSLSSKLVNSNLHGDELNNVACSQTHHI